MDARRYIRSHQVILDDFIDPVLEISFGIYSFNALDEIHFLLDLELIVVSHYLNLNLNANSKISQEKNSPINNYELRLARLYPSTTL